MSQFATSKKDSTYRQHIIPQKAYKQAGKSFSFLAVSEINTNNVILHQ